MGSIGRVRSAVLAAMAVAASLLVVLVAAQTHATGKPRLTTERVGRMFNSADRDARGVHAPKVDCRGQRRQVRAARLSSPDPAGARLFTRKQVLCSFGSLRWLKPGEVVAVQRTTYGRAQRAHPALLGSSPNVVDPNRIVWLMTWYYAMPVRYHLCQYADCPAPEPDRIVKINAYSEVINAATGTTTDWCMGCTAAPRPRASKSGRPSAAARTPLHPVLEANGIGSARFGTPERVVLARLTRLYGAPEIPRGRMGGCSEVGWAGLKPASKPGQTPASAMHVELRVEFRRSGFVGYSYYQSVPFRGRRTRQPSLMLNTARGLTVGTTAVRARGLYGHTFAAGPAVMGAGVPWTTTTPAGRMYGEMTIPEPHFRQVIQIINAGTSIDSGCP
jgi:hypothetical protein